MMRTHPGGSRSRRATPTVADVRDALDEIAPPALAQSWDNVGLLLGDAAAPVRGVLLCIDLTPAVVREAIRRRIDLVVAYHPPIFKPISRLLAESRQTDALVFRCARAGVALYSPHTALDAARGGTNDVLAALAGVENPDPLEYADAPGPARCKLVSFVPREHVDHVAEALFAVGAGHIGDYERCSYRVSGQGTFLAGTSSNPSVGARGRFETVEEVRLELIVPADRVPHAIQTLRASHPYEEPAFDVYPLNPEPTFGIGRVGRLRRPEMLGVLASRLRRALSAACVQVVGRHRMRVGRAVIVAGAAGSLPFRAALGPSDVVITGELRHHDALAFQRYGAGAIALGHWASERPVLESLAKAVRGRVRSVRVSLSVADADPFRAAGA